MHPDGYFRVSRVVTFVSKSGYFSLTLVPERVEVI